MASLLKQLEPEVTLASAGTAQAVSTTPVLCESILIVADSANAGTIYVGDSSVNSDNGAPLTAGQSMEIASDHDFLDLQDVWIDGSATSDVVRVIYLAAQGRRG